MECSADGGSEPGRNLTPVWTFPTHSFPASLDARIFPRSWLWLDRGRDTWDWLECDLHSDVPEGAKLEMRLSTKVTVIVGNDVHLQRRLNETGHDYSEGPMISQEG